MKKIVYTKIKLLEIIKKNEIINNSFIINEKKNLILFIQKNVIWKSKIKWSWKYFLSLSIWEKIIWKNKDQDSNNYINIVDDIHEFLIKKNLLPLSSWISLIADWKSLESEDLFIEKNIVQEKFKEIKRKKENFDPQRLLNNKKESEREVKKLLEVIDDFTNALNSDKLENISEITLIEDDSIVVTDRKKGTYSRLIWDLNLWKSLLIAYISNIPFKYSKGNNIEQEIVLSVNSGENIIIYVKINKDNEWNIENIIYNNIEKDFSIPFTLCNLEDLIIDKTSLTNWIEDLFYSFNIKKIKNISF